MVSYLSTMQIRPAVSQDRAAVWSIIGPIIRAGETYTLDRDMSEGAALAYWKQSPEGRWEKKA